jgi:hypothetical protein
MYSLAPFVFILDLFSLKIKYFVIFTSSKKIYLTKSPFSPCGNKLSLESYNINSIVSASPIPK